MRSKLVIATSFIAAVAGTGTSFGIVALAGSYWPRMAGLEIGAAHPSLAIVLVYLPIVGAAVLAALFIYRHTARRRKTQAIMSATLVLLVSILALFLLAPILFPLHLNY